MTLSSPEPATTLQPALALRPVPGGRRQIYFYLSSFDGGGAERVFVRLANHYVASGIDVRFVVNEASGPVRALLHGSVEVVELGHRRSFRALPRLISLLRRERPPVLVSAMTGNNATALLARALARSPTRIITSERNHVGNLMRHWRAPRRLMHRVMLRVLYPGADHLTAVTDDVADNLSDLTGIGRDRIAVIHNPLPEDDDIAEARAAPVPHHWFEEDEPVVVAMGRLVPQKGFKVLLEAIAEVRQHMSVKLIVLGQGPLQAELETEAARLGIADAVAFPGFTERRFDYLVNAALYVLSSDTEGFPNALLEALACDIPVVSTDCAGGGPRVILGDASNSIVPVGDANRMAEAILGALRRQRKPGENAARVQQFSMQNTAETFLRIVDAVQSR